jgi:UDP-glucuronate 4-epimerase
MGADTEPGTVLNVGGGAPVRVADVIAEVERVAGHVVPLVRRGPSMGDVATTHADTSSARSQLGWAPRTSLADGIAAQARWQLAPRARVSATAGGRRPPR